MKNSSLQTMMVGRLVLLLSGLAVSGIALAIQTAPEMFYASYGIELGGDRSLINELKAPAGALLLAGVLILAGAIRVRLMMLSTATAAAVYLSFGLSRILSMIVDGLPNDALVSAAVAEVAIGTICLVSLFSHYRQAKVSET